MSRYKWAAAPSNDGACFFEMYLAGCRVAGTELFEAFDQDVDEVVEASCFLQGFMNDEVVVS